MGLFSILKRSDKRDAFAEREKQQRVWQTIRRIVDLSTPNAATDETSDRHWQRYNRCIPIGCVPMIGEDIDESTIFFGATKDFSDNGVSLIASQWVNCEQIVCGFWQDDLTLLQGAVRRVKEFGGGLHEIGVEFSQLIEAAGLIRALTEPLRELQPGRSQQISSAV